MRRAALLAVLAALVLPASALGAQRYAAPGGGTTVGCPRATPCSLSYAITAAGAGDEVIVTPGTYNLSAGIEATAPLNIHGEAGQPRPRIVGSAEITPLKSLVAQTISDLRIEALSAAGGALFVVGNGSVFDHLELLAVGTGALALRPGVNFTLTDSLLVASGSPNATGLFVQGVAPGTSQLRNDTIVASGAESIGVSVYVTAPSTIVTIYAANVIAQGATDASAGATSGSTGLIAFDHSNLDTMSGPVTSSNGQTAQPAFVDAGAGNYREAAGSPMIDSGLNDPANGTTDLDGNPRALPGRGSCTEAGPPAITDIGAFEYVPAVPACAPAGPTLHTKITKVRIHGRKAIFRFTGSGAKNLKFNCKIDRQPWRRCRSPRTYSHLKPGRHTFRVQAMLARGVFDSKPVKRKFRIRRPR
jgi:hypothetical protein